MPAEESAQPPENPQDTEEIMWHGCHMIIFQGEASNSHMAVTRSAAAPAASLPDTAPVPAAAPTTTATAPAPASAPAAVATSAPSPAPSAGITVASGIQRQPLPRPFAQSPVSRSIPASSLPDPVRQARQQITQPPAPAAAAVPPALTFPLPASTDSVAVATPEETALTASISFVAAQGPGILEQLLIDSPHILAQLNGTTVSIPLSALRIPLTMDLLSSLLQNPARPAAPATAAPATEHAVQVLTMHGDSEHSYDSDLPPLLDLSDSDCSHASLPSCLDMSILSATLPLVPPMSTHILGVDTSHLSQCLAEPAAPMPVRCYDPLGRLPCTVAFTEFHADVGAAPGPSHIACASLAAHEAPHAPYTRQPVIVMPYPSVYSLTGSDPSTTVCLVDAATNEILCHPLNIVDSGSNMIIITLDLCTMLGLLYSLDDVTSTATSSGTVTNTVGKLITPVNIVLGKGTEHEMSLRLPIHVMGGRHSTFQLLLGTPWMNAIGAVIDCLNSTLTYCPALQRNADTSYTHTIPLTTTARNPSLRYQQDLTNPNPFPVG